MYKNKKKTRLKYERNFININLMSNNMNVLDLITFKVQYASFYKCKIYKNLERLLCDISVKNLYIMYERRATETL